MMNAKRMVVPLGYGNFLRVLSHLTYHALRLTPHVLRITFYVVVSAACYGILQRGGKGGISLLSQRKRHSAMTTILAVSARRICDPSPRMWIPLRRASSTSSA